MKTNSSIADRAMDFSVDYLLFPHLTFTEGWPKPIRFILFFLGFPITMCGLALSAPIVVFAFMSDLYETL